MIPITVTCRGLTPLLMNRMTADVLEGIRVKAKKSKNAARPATPREEAEPKVYATTEGIAYLPTENLLSCLISAGAFVRLDGKRQVSTAKSTTLPAFLTISDPYLPLHVPTAPRQRPTWEVDMRQGKNPNGGEAVCVVRPRFDVWGFAAHILVDTSEIAEAVVRDLWDKAGKRIGVGDFRPQRKGMFGQFVVERWQQEVVADAAE